MSWTTTLSLSIDLHVVSFRCVDNPFVFILFVAECPIFCNCRSFGMNGDRRLFWNEGIFIFKLDLYEITWNNTFMLLR